METLFSAGAKFQVLKATGNSAKRCAQLKISFMIQLATKQARQLRKGCADLVVGRAVLAAETRTCWANVSVNQEFSPRLTDGDLQAYAFGGGVQVDLKTRRWLIAASVVGFVALVVGFFLLTLLPGLQFGFGH